jgi:hypothetical protein
VCICLSITSAICLSLQVLLQASNIALLPVGVALIGAAAYVADTAVGPETSFTSFAIFILGVFVIVLLLLGCVGTSLQSRGIVKVFMLLTGLVGLAFLAFGIMALVWAATLAALITQQWDAIRKVLPPDFAGTHFGCSVHHNVT